MSLDFLTKSKLACLNLKRSHWKRVSVFFAKGKKTAVLKFQSGRCMLTHHTDRQVQVLIAVTLLFKVVCRRGLQHILGVHCLVFVDL